MSAHDTEGRSDQDSLRNWFSSSRRDALLVGGGALVYLLSLLERAYADAEFRIEPSPENNPKSTAGNVEAGQTNTSSNVSNVDEKVVQPEEDQSKIEDQLGGAYRAPSFQNLTATQARATGTPEKKLEYLSVAPGSFFSDN
jgi:hypothetical protein